MQPGTVQRVESDSRHRIEPLHHLDGILARLGRITEAGVEIVEQNDRVATALRGLLQELVREDAGRHRWRRGRRRGPVRDLLSVEHGDGLRLTIVEDFKVFLPQALNRPLLSCAATLTCTSVVVVRMVTPDGAGIWASAHDRAAAARSGSFIAEAFIRPILIVLLPPERFQDTGASKEKAVAGRRRVGVGAGLQ